MEKKYQQKIDDKVEKVEETVVHYVFTIFFSIATAVLVTLCLR